MAKKYSLTDEHRAQLPAWRDQWIANTMSTAAMTEEDRRLCREAVLGLYSAANLPPPKHIVFVPSPFVLRFAGGFAAAVWWKAKNKRGRAATDEATYEATAAATRAATAAATAEATYAATRAATDAATYAATDAATDAATYAATAAGFDDHWFSVDIKAQIALSRHFGGRFALRCAVSAYQMWAGGNQWSAWVSWLSFFRHIVGLQIDYSKWQYWETLTAHSGPRIMHPDFCMISDRPEILTVDNQHRPHNDTGPFCRWRDGSALYAVHDVRVPRWVVEKPERLTVERIDTEPNAEIRRVMLDRFGWSRYLKAGGSTPVDHEEGIGTLHRKPVKNDEDLVMVEVVNSSPESDGSWKRYILRVPPTTKTAREAVAWTFGMTAAEYRPSVET